MKRTDNVTRFFVSLIFVQVLLLLLVRIEQQKQHVAFAFTFQPKRIRITTTSDIMTTTSFSVYSNSRNNHHIPQSNLLSPPQRRTTTTTGSALSLKSGGGGGDRRTTAGGGPNKAIDGTSDRGPVLLTLSLCIVVWLFSIPPEFRRAHICATQPCIENRSSCNDCVTYNEWTTNVKEYYTNGGGIQFDFSIDPITIQKNKDFIKDTLGL